MSGLLQHLKVSAVADGTDTSQVQPSDWNAAHKFTGGNHGAIPIRDTTDATFGSSWLASVAAGQVLISNGVGAPPTWSSSLTLSGGLTLTGALTAQGATLTGDLLFSPDATYDIGKTGASRPRDIFATRNIQSAGTMSGVSVSGTASSFVTGVFAATNNAQTLVVQTAGLADGFTVLQVANAGGDGRVAMSRAGGGDVFTGSLGNAMGVGTNNAKPLQFATSAIVRWTIHTDGGLSSDATSPGLNRLRVTSADPIQIPSVGNATGTVAVVDASGFIYKQTSSGRYKEHIDPWRIAPEALAAFVALTPKAWDYTGQETGAGGFLAEDLAALDIRNPYGRSVLVNYDAEGRPESNRDGALIGVHHLIIRSLWRRVAALEGDR